MEINDHIKISFSCITLYCIEKFAILAEIPCYQLMTVCNIGLTVEQFSIASLITGVGVSGVVVCCRCHWESRPQEGGGIAQAWATWPEGASAPNGTVMCRGHGVPEMLTPAMRTTAVLLGFLNLTNMPCAVLP